MTSAYRLIVEEHPGYLHVTAVGERTAQNVLRLLEDAYRACVERERSSLLLELRLCGQSLDATSIFNVISKRAADGAKLHRVAYVDPVTRDVGDARFAETVAVNRGVNVRLFPDVTTAAQWLSAVERS